MEEKGTAVDAVNNNDAKMIELFFGQINIDARATKFYWLGKPTPNKNRPLKLEMTNNTESDAMMINLNRLKGSEEVLTFEVYAWLTSPCDNVIKRKVEPK